MLVLGISLVLWIRGDFCGGQEVDGGVCARRII